MTASVAMPAKTTALDFAVHPSGEITVVEVHSREGSSQRSIWLRRLGADLRTIREAPLRYRPTDHERLVYNMFQAVDGSFYLGEMEMLNAPASDIVEVESPVWTKDHLQLAARGEDAIVLTAFDFGTRVYAISPAFEVQWSRQVMPTAYPPASTVETLTVDDAGRIGIAFIIDPPTFLAWKRHFEREELEWSGSFFQTMVTRIGPNGQETISRTFGHDGDFVPAGISLRGDEVTLCGSVRTKDRYAMPNKTMDSDVAWMRGDLTGGPLRKHAVNLERDEYTWACRPDAQGGLLFAGSTDFWQADTHSWLQDGKAFFYAVDASGNETARITFRGPRRTEIKSFNWTKNGGAAFGGTFDGPITHTPSSESASKAMIGIWR